MALEFDSGEGVAKQVVLIGAGHGHLEVARRGLDLTRQGIAWTLIDPGNFWYSGRATAMLTGSIKPHQDQIDPEPLVSAGQGRLIRGTVTKVDPASRLVTIDNGETVTYDVLSMNVGSVVDGGGFPANDRNVYPVKPLSAMWDIAERLRTSRTGMALAVIGGGVTGCEVCACLAAMIRARGLPHKVHLVHGGQSVASGLTEKAAQIIDRHLRNLGVDIHLNQRAESYPGDQLLLSGKPLSVDCVVLATGLRANSLCRQNTGDESNQSDGIVVNDTLQSVVDPRVFAIGDCACMQNYALPRHGVFAVRAASTLVDNLGAACFNRDLKSYTPQKKYLSIINLGDGRAMALWGGLHWYGRLPMVWKEALDRRFMQRYRYD